jgi:hypothetical protein
MIDRISAMPPASSDTQLQRFPADVSQYDRIPATASRAPVILSGCTRLERLRYAAEQSILDWRDADATQRPASLLIVRDAQSRISRAKYRNAQLASEMSARTWVDNWEPAR